MVMICRRLRWGLLPFLMRVISVFLMHALECGPLGPLREVFVLVIGVTLVCVANVLPSVEHVDDVF